MPIIFKKENTISSDHLDESLNTDLHDEHTGHINIIKTNDDLNIDESFNNAKNYSNNNNGYYYFTANKVIENEPKLVPEHTYYHDLATKQPKNEHKDVNYVNTSNDLN